MKRFITFCFLLTILTYFSIEGHAVTVTGDMTLVTCSSYSYSNPSSTSQCAACNKTLTSVQSYSGSTSGYYDDSVKRYYSFDNSILDSNKRFISTDNNRIYKNCNVSNFGTESSTRSVTPYGCLPSPSGIPYSHGGYSSSGHKALSAKCTILSGRYESSPALNSPQITVNRGTIVDNNGSHSVFSLGDDSEQTIVVNDTQQQTITTVKLLNPPIVIDWSTFPGIDWADFPG